MLRENFFSAEQILAIVDDFTQAGLSSEEVDLMAFAQKVVLRPQDIDEADFDRLRQHGLSDEAIFDVLLAAAARSFFTKVMDATGARPDEQYLELEPELVQALGRGRAFP